MSSSDFRSAVASFFAAALLTVIWEPIAAATQTGDESTAPLATDFFTSPHGSPPSDEREGWLASEPEAVETFPAASSASGMTPERLRELMKPVFRWQADWVAPVDGYQLSNYAGSVTVPTYPIFGPPPPLITASFDYSDWDLPAGADLPTELYQIRLGSSWIRPLANGWTLRFSLDGVFASDFENTSSQAWQLRGGGFAMIPRNERWTYVVGALVTGRNDVPVIPAAGAIWTPAEDRRVELMLPRPRIAYRLIDGIERQQWVYLGAGWGGNNWAYESEAGVDDEVTYREWMTFLGWEWVPRREPGEFRGPGKQIAAEVGYVFGRSFEFESARPELDLGDTAVFRIRIQH